MRRPLRKASLVVLISLMGISTASCESESLYSYQVPEYTGDGLAVGSLPDAAIDIEPLASALDSIATGKYGEVHAFLIYRDGRLVLEEYFPGHDYAWDAPGFHGAWRTWDRDTAHNIHSAGKSVASLCAGIAIELGFIGDVNQSIFEYLPEHGHLNSDGKGQITIEHLLTMSSGLEWDEWGSSYSDAGNDVISLWLDCDDPVTCILSRPLVSDPGSGFTYSGGNLVLLGEIIRHATGTDLQEFAAEHLFTPLGISPPQWPRIADSGVIYAGDIRLTPRDMVKMGVTCLGGGVWNGVRVIPETWVERCASPYDGPGNTWFNSFLRQIPPGDSSWGRRGYSYTWWVHEFTRAGVEFPVYWAFGWGGQVIAVLPEQDTVVVMTGATYTAADSTPTILADHVIPALY